QDGRKLDEALAAFGRDNGIRRVRILKTEKSVREVTHGKSYRKSYSPGDNHCIEIFELPDGEWDGEGITVFDANQPDYMPAWRRTHPDARLVMRVHNGDLIEADSATGDRSRACIAWSHRQDAYASRCTTKRAASTTGMPT